MNQKIRKVLIVANEKKEKVAGIVDCLEDDLKKRNITFQQVSPTYFQLDNQDILTDFDTLYKHQNYDLIIPVGGDGTFLYTARTFLEFNIPIVGIHGGRLGFLMAVNPEEIASSLDKIISGEASLENRVLLEARVIRDNKEIYFLPFLNDAVVSRGALSRMVELSVSMGGEDLSQYRSDGLIVSTPTGSTAYNLAAGGPILTPEVDAVILTPICPHTLGVRPIVTGSSNDLQITIISSETDTTLTMDGQEKFTLRPGDCIRIGKASRLIQIYDCCEKPYFHVLREKMGWNI